MMICEDKLQFSGKMVFKNDLKEKKISFKKLCDCKLCIWFYL